MREPSRRLPPPTPPTPLGHVAGWGCLLLVAASLLAGAWRHPYTAGWILAGFALLSWLINLAEDYPPHRRARLFRLRPTDNAICHFARAFDCRVTDTWLIRAVFEEVQRCFGKLRYPLPVRASERLYHDLGLEFEDLVEIVLHAAKRAGYSLDEDSLDEDRSNHPSITMETVGDIVNFLQLQPCTRHVAPGRS